MSREDDDNKAHQELQQISKQAKRNQIILIATLSITVCIISVMSTGLAVLFKRLSDLNDSATIEVETRLAELDSEVDELRELHRQDQQLIAQYQSRLENFEEQCNQQQLAELRTLMTTREDDFQALLETSASGTSSLAKMMLGSRKWLDSHEEALQKLINSSQRRQALLEPETKE